VRNTAVLLAVLVVAVRLAGAAFADPGNSPNDGTESFSCSNGSNVVTFTGTATMQSHTATGHVLTASDPSLDGAVFQAKYVTIDDQVVKTTPGFDGRQLIDCTLTAIGDQPPFADIHFIGFFTPASG
jgi:hypothetical protein